MMYTREGGYTEEDRSYYIPGNSPAPPTAHRAHRSTTNAFGGQVNLTLVIFIPQEWCAII